MTLVPVQEHSAISTLDLAPQAWDLAQKIARTEFVPIALRGKPEAVLAAILTGYEVGISPMQSLKQINVIEGKPGMAAELMRALVFAHGHEFNIDESTGTRCTVVVRRKSGDRDARFTWTMDDAKRAGLDGKQNWRKYPRAMLLARATTEAVRAVFPDVVAGISYSLEELTDGDFLDLEDVEAARTVEAPAPKGSTARAQRAATAPAAPARAAVAPAAVQLEEDAPLPGEPGFDELAQTEPSPVTGDGAPEESDAVGAADSSPPSDTDEGALPLTQRVAMWCVEAQEILGLKPSDEWRHRFLAAFSGGAYASATDVPAADVEELREKLNQVRTGQLVIGERDGVPTLLWAARDHEQSDDDAAEVIDFDWWMRRIAAVCGIGQNTLLKKARALAEELELDVPSAVEEINEPALVAAVEQWLDEKAAGE